MSTWTYFDSEAAIRMLEARCRETGSIYLQKVNYGNEHDIMISCPFHGGGTEQHPSCGVKKDEDVGHCFTCGWSGHISDIASRVLNTDGVRWMNEHFDYRGRTSGYISYAANGRRDRGNRSVQAPKPFDDMELEMYRCRHPYMYERGLDDAIIDEFNIGYDGITDAITFPIYERNGTPAFIARRSVKSKFFMIPSGARKPLYLGERVKEHTKDLWVCESCLDALIAIKNGHPAVALMGLGNEEQFNDLFMLNCRSYVLAFDNDLAGQAAAEKVKKLLSPLSIVKKIVFPTHEKVKDINDCKDCFDKLSVIWA